MIASAYPITVDKVTGRQEVRSGVDRHAEHLKMMGAIIEGEVIFFPDMGVTVMVVMEEAQTEQLQILISQIIIQDVLTQKPDIVVDTDVSGFYEFPDGDSETGKSLMFVLYYYPKEDPQITTVQFGSTEQDSTKYLTET